MNEKFFSDQPANDIVSGKTVVIVGPIEDNAGRFQEAYVVRESELLISGVPESHLRPLPKEGERQIGYRITPISLEIPRIVAKTRSP